MTQDMVRMDAAEWDARYEESDLVWGAEPNQFVARELAGVPAGRALDVGTGEGRNAIWLASLGWRVTAVDFSAVALDRGRRFAAARDLEIDWVHADLRTYRPEPRGYDAVVVAYIHLVPEGLADVLGAAADAVAPGGQIVVVGHDRANLSDGVGGPQDPDVLYTVDSVVDALRGLEVLRAETVHRSVTTADGEAQAIDTLVRADRMTPVGR
jgi:SAM-dependent methyltransferase